MKISDGEIALKVLGEPLELEAFGHRGEAKTLTADGKPVKFDKKDGGTAFGKRRIKRSLKITF